MPDYGGFPGAGLQIIVISNAAVVVSAKFVVEYKHGGRKDLSLTATTASTRTSEIFTSADSLQEFGSVIGGNVSANSGNTQRGQTYLVASLIDGATATPLCRGYVYPGHGLALGEFVEPGPAGGHGHIRSLALGGPGAGADYADQVVPAGALWRPRGWGGQLVTAVAAANRKAGIRYIDSVSGNIMGGQYFGGVQIASQTVTYISSLGGSQTDVNGTSTLVTDIDSVGTPDTLLRAADIWRWTTLNIQGADQWGAGQSQIEEWVMP